LPAAWSSIVVIRDLADPGAVFRFARAAACNDATWGGYDFGAVRMLVTGPCAGAVRVSVHFPAAGGTFFEDGHRNGSMAVMFLTEQPSADPRALHEEIIGRLGVFLAREGLRWEWQHQGDEWRVGA